MDVSNHTLFMDAGGVNIFIGNVSTVGTTWKFSCEPEKS
jgi:hypothetical protein